VLDEKRGLIAILDALGAAVYGEREIARFLESRAAVLEILRDKAHVQEAGGQLDEGAVSIFTFNDTILIVLRTGKEPTLSDVERFGVLLRRFLVESLAHGILFRGSLSIGRFYVDEASNTVMGAAVTDAAAWYDAAEWVGINATPHASMVIESLLEQATGDLDRVLVDYDVPFKEGKVQRLKAVNWPKGFYVKGVRPVAAGERERAKCLSLLASHGVPKGAERKHANSIAFFDHCASAWKKSRRAKAG
jgi:hypothetical protein